MFSRKLLVGVLVIAFAATAANAYTVVMRSGRQVEIPNTFTVTKSTLTYETAPGIQITLQLSTIDVAATERLNNQPGSLSLNAAKPSTTVAPQEPATRARRSITNQDLESYRRARLEGERQRKELGLPSAEERRKETEEIEDRLVEQARTMRSQEELDFWRSRTAQLEAQIGSLNNQVNDVPVVYPSGIDYGFDGYHRFNRFGFNDNFGFNRNPGFNKNFGFNNRFGFNPGFNIFNQFPGHFRGRLIFTAPRPRGGAPNMGRHGFHGGGRSGGRGGGGRR